MIVLATVPHTGTSFFRDLLRQHFRPYRDFIVRHVHDDVFADLDNRTVVTTIRDDEDVRRSHIKRGENPGALEGYWRNWDRVVAEYDPIIVSVDAVDRDARLDNLSEALGVEFETDWAPVNAWTD